MVTIPTGLFLATLSLQDLYFQWEAAGVFDFFLPGLLIFAVIFGILSTTKILGDNRGVTFLISLSIAILAIRVPLVSAFFTTIFPGLGIGVAILLSVFILAGLFINKGNFDIFSGIFSWGGVVIALIIVIATLNSFSWFGSPWWQDNWTTIVWILLLVAVVAPMVLPKTSPEDKARRFAAYQSAYNLGR